MFNIENTEEKIQEDYNKFMEYINADPRAEQLNIMHFQADISIIFFELPNFP